MKLITSTLNGVKNNEIPIWIMRQAGRYLPEYRALRKEFSSFMEFCLDPEAAAEATLQPLHRFDLDAAIIFSDILIIPEALGMKVKFIEGQGPQLSPLSSLEQLTLDKQTFLKVFAAITRTKAAIDDLFPTRALIGFAGGVWTVACYMIEGKGSKDFVEVRKYYYANREAFMRLITLLVDVTAEYLIGQIEAGAEIIKIFDSWAGLLPPQLFEELVIKPTAEIVARVKARYSAIPIIGFPRGAGLLYKEYAAKTGVDCVAVDQNIPIWWARDCLQQNKVIQGNLDNALLFGDKCDIENGARAVLDGFSEKAFVFNLGHGILPGTPIAGLEHLINLVKNYGRDGKA